MAGTRFPQKTFKAVAGTFLTQALPGGSIELTADAPNLETWQHWERWRRRLEGGQSPGWAPARFPLAGGSAGPPRCLVPGVAGCLPSDPVFQLPLADYWALNGPAKAAVTRRLGGELAQQLLLQVGQAARVVPALWPPRPSARWGSASIGGQALKFRANGLGAGGERLPSAGARLVDPGGSAARPVAPARRQCAKAGVRRQQRRLLPADRGPVQLRAVYRRRDRQPRGVGGAARVQVRTGAVPWPVDANRPRRHGRGPAPVGATRRARDAARGAVTARRRGRGGRHRAGLRPGPVGDARTVARPGRLHAHRPAAGLRRDPARLPAARPVLAPLPGGHGLRNVPGRRHGPGQDGAGDRPAAQGTPRRP